MAAVGHFGCLKFTFDHTSGHFRSMRDLIFFEIFDKMAAVGHFGCLKFTFDRISGHFRSIWNLIYFFCKMAAVGHFGCPKFTFDHHFLPIQNFFFGFFLQNGSSWPCPKFTFDRISGHFRSIRNFFLEFFTKWPPADILDVQKSLLIAFLAISD